MRTTTVVQCITLCLFTEEQGIIRMYIYMYGSVIQSVEPVC